MIFNREKILDEIINTPLSAFKLFLLKNHSIIQRKIVHNQWNLYKFLDELAPSNTYDTVIIAGTEIPNISDIKIFMDERLLKYLGFIRQDIEKIPEEIELHYRSSGKIKTINSPYFLFNEVRDRKSCDSAALFSSNSQGTFVAECVKLLEDAGYTFDETRIISNPEKRNVSDIVIKWLKDREDIKKCIVFFDIPPAHIVKIQDKTGVEIISRNDLIISIFDERADGSSGKLKYASALIQKEKSLKRKRAVGLSRLTGGIGLKGPGETKGEERKRILKNKEKVVRKMLDKELNRLDSQKKFREKNNLGSVAIVGYTNAGKSTLFNALLGKKAVEESARSFSSIDPKVRKTEIDGKKVLLIDTVGFVTDMSKDITDAFSATFSLVSSALILHIVDSTSKGWIQKKEYIEELLKKYNCSSENTVTLFSKSDLIKIKHPVKTGFYYNAKNISDIKKIRDLIATKLFKDKG